MNAYAARLEVGPWPASRERVARLLKRYPEVSKNEKQEILLFMKKGRYLDIGLLSSDDKLRPNLDAFMEDHQRHLRLGFEEAAAIVAVIAAFLVICWLFWDLAGPGPL